MSNETLPAPGSTERTRLRRIPEKAVTERATLHAVLDAAYVAHVAVLTGSQPYVVPVGCARDGEALLMHGSTGSRLFRTLADGAPTCATVTLLDGMVLARSAFESSMRYRGAMVLGVCRVLDGEEKDRALRVISDHLLPGRWEDIRSPSRKELAATMVLSLPLDEASVKISDGWPDDAEEDLGRETWYGVVPLVESWGAPLPDPGNTQPLPAYLSTWTRA